MINQAVAKRYGKALLQIAQERNALDKFQSDLELVVETLENDQQLRNVWFGKEFDNETRIKVVKELFGAKIDEMVVNLLCVVVEKGREASVGDILAMYQLYADEARNIAYADVISAYELTDGQAEEIKTALGKMSGKEICLNASVDQSLLGGIKVIFGDKVFDGTVTARLLGMKNKLHEIQF